MVLDEAGVVEGSGGRIVTVAEAEEAVDNDEGGGHGEAAEVR